MRWMAVGSLAFAVSLSSGAFADPYRPFSWTGMYIGANVGYGWGKADTDFIGTLTTGGGGTVSRALSDTANLDGWLGGGQIGYNWQSQKWVLGVEADIQASGQDGSSSSCSSAACGLGSVTLNADYKLDWFGTARGRVGYLFDPKVLVYGTGGLAYGHFGANYTAAIVGAPGSLTFGDDGLKAGWVVGGGVEAALNKHWFVKVEYLYMDLGLVSHATDSLIFAGGPAAQRNILRIDAAADTHFTDQIVRVGLNYKFGDPEHVPLK